MTPSPFFRDVAAAHPRCFWLDGGGAREWSGPALDHRLARRRRRLADLSTPRAREVTPARRRRRRGRRRRRLRRARGELAAAPGEQWFGYLGYASRPDLPARPDPDLPDAVWMRPRQVRFVRARAPRSAGRCSIRTVADGRPDRRTAVRLPEAYAAAFAARPGAPPRRQLLRGQPHLPARAVEADLDPVDGVPPAARPQPRAVRRLPPARRRRRAGVAAELELAGALRPGHRRPAPRDQADQGHHPARRDARGGRGAARPAGQRPQDPRREPDDRRPAPQRPVDGVRGRARSRCRR